ncbi:hypothetical protein Dimus_023464 [Dionaea muscipula]
MDEEGSLASPCARHAPSPCSALSRHAWYMADLQEREGGARPFSFPHGLALLVFLEPGAGLFLMSGIGLPHGIWWNSAMEGGGRARHFLHAWHTAELGLFTGSALASSSRPAACYGVRLGKGGARPSWRSSDWSRVYLSL